MLPTPAQLYPLREFLKLMPPGILLEFHTFWTGFGQAVIEQESAPIHFRRIHILFSKQLTSQSNSVWYFIVILQHVELPPGNGMKFSYLVPVNASNLRNPSFEPRLWTEDKIVQDIADRVARGDSTVAYTLAVDNLSCLGLLDHDGLEKVLQWVYSFR